VGPIATKDSYPVPVCRAVFSAGAITSANMIGVNRGTTSARGQLKAAPGSVASGPSGRTRSAK
jgi:hypothetical protein